MPLRPWSQSFPHAPLPWQSSEISPLIRCTTSWMGLADFDRMRLNLIGQRLAYLVNTYGATEEVRDFVCMLMQATDWEENDDGLGDSETDSDEDWDESEDYDESEVYDYDESEVDDSD